MFILMGSFAYHIGLSSDAFFAAQKWVGHLPGGLAIATMAGGAVFAAVSGASVASAAAFGKIAVPEMRKYGYDPGIACASVVAAGTLSPLIPPSIMLIVYGISTEQDVGKLLIGGALPGLLSALNYSLMIILWGKLRPQLVPAFPVSSWRERWKGLKATWAVLMLIVIVIGGIYSGLFTPTEAGAVGAAGTLVLGFMRRRLTKRIIWDSLIDGARTSSMIFIIVIGAFIFVQFLAYSRVPIGISEYIVGMDVPPIVVLILICCMYLILGCFMEGFGMLLLTIPFIFPTTQSLGYDPIWFGVIVVKLIEIGMITPPVGLNLFVVKGTVPDVPLETIIRQSIPFVLTDFLTLALLIAFPQIILVLPNMMG
jgi:tripartite ATP-independent transporter DctM subunit